MLEMLLAIVWHIHIPVSFPVKKKVCYDLKTVAILKIKV